MTIVEDFRRAIREFLGIPEEQITFKPQVVVTVSAVKYLPFRKMNSGYKNITTLINLYQLDWEKDLQEWGYKTDYILLQSTDYDIYVGFYGNPQFLLKAGQGFGVYTDDVRKIFVKPASTSASVYAILFKY